MQDQTVYYLVHTESGRRIRYYRTLAGAHIGLRLRNRNLGFVNRVQLEHNEDLGITHELYLVNNELVRGTYSIQEDHIESVLDELLDDLLDDPA